MAGSRMLRQVNKRKRFNIILSVREIEELLDRLPEEGRFTSFSLRADFPVSALCGSSPREQKFWS